MKKVLSILVILIAFAAVAPQDVQAQQLGRVRAFGGFSFMRLNAGGSGEIPDVKENLFGLQWTWVSVEHTNREGYVLQVQEDPSGVGSVFIYFNNSYVEVPTAGFATARELNMALLEALRGANLRFRQVKTFFHLMFDHTENTGIWRLGFRSTDPAIHNSDILLVPPGRLLHQIGLAGGRD